VLAGNIKGYTGSASTAAGYSGSLGYYGSVGYTGSVGYYGSTGYWGSVGYTGSTTPAAGYAGSTGYWGSVGYTGSSSSGASVTIATTAPVSPSAGQFWYKSDEGKLYIYYNDGDSSQWVGITASIAGGAGVSGGGSTVNISDTFVSVFLLGL
jgi:hypothetical protein